MPTGENSKADGQSDEPPLHIDGVAADDFRTFLRALYLGFTVLSSPLTEQEIVAALILAKTWRFDKLRPVLIDSLDSLKLAPTRKLELAHIYGVGQWYRKNWGFWHDARRP